MGFSAIHEHTERHFSPLWNKKGGTRHEDDLSAEEEEPCKGSRLPSENADRERKKGSFRKTRKGQTSHFRIRSQRL
jgi:hypothetical protein